MFTSHDEETTTKEDDEPSATNESVSLEKTCGTYVFTSYEERIVNGAKFTREHQLATDKECYDKKSRFVDDTGVVDIETALPGQPPETKRTLFNIKEEEVDTFLKDFEERVYGDGKYLQISDDETLGKLGCSHKSALDFD